MNWVLDRYSSNVSAIYSSGLSGGLSKLEFLWPLFIGGVIFALIDYSLQPQGAVRWISVMLLLGPGAVWASLLLFHEIRSLPSRIRCGKIHSERQN